MSPDEFRLLGRDIVDWIADYLEHAERYPVLSPVEPGQVRDGLEAHPPEQGEPWREVWRDFTMKVLPGVTHWQSPNFFAYFPANVSYPSILGELLSAGLGINGMLWSTSPAATELEMLVLDWLVEMLDLPPHFKGAGVIQDTASSASLCAILCGREQAIEWRGNETGLAETGQRLRLYASDQAHSSIEKAAMIAGIGRDQVRLIATDESGAMIVDGLRDAIETDLSDGAVPCAVVATVGTTSSLGCDPLRPIGEVCRAHNVWLHVDGAMAGSALICPEFRDMADGLELADSFCFNPHKWLLTNFDLDAFYIRDPQRLVRTLSVLPEYLRAEQAEGVVNYRDWHIPLGRRFRALKLWFVIRHYGIEGLQRHIREHVRLAGLFADWVRADDRFEIVVEPRLNLVCFRLKDSDEANRDLLNRLNASGRLFLTHTRLSDRYTLRMCIGQTNTREEHVRAAWEAIRARAKA